jgi:hypothetical protein
MHNYDDQIKENKVEWRRKTTGPKRKAKKKSRELSPRRRRPLSDSLLRRGRSEKGG